jgi:hypothetical protein
VDTAAIVVAVGFGALMGFSLGRFLTDLRPVVIGLLFGLGCGAVIWVLGVGDDPTFVAGSLLLGCGGALAGLAPRLSLKPPSG